MRCSGSGAVWRSPLCPARGVLRHAPPLVHQLGRIRADPQLQVNTRSSRPTPAARKRTKQDAIGYFRDFVDTRNKDSLKTLVKLKLLDKSDAKAVKHQKRNKIDCYARDYKRGSAASDWDKTQTLHHSLRNYP